MKQQYTTPYGVMECYDHYLIFHRSSNRITVPAAKEIVKYAERHFGKKKYVFISKRSSASVVDPKAYKAINRSLMIGLAIVSESNAVKQQAYVEQKLYDGSFCYFKTINEAVDWAKTMVKAD